MKITTMARNFIAIASVVFSLSAVANHHMSDKKDIVETAQHNDQFSTLVTAIQAAGITETLQKSGDLTVFAPTNAAFEALPEGTLESLLKPENKEKLIQVLTYHVVEGKVTASEVTQLDSATSLEGSQIDINADKSGVMVNDATVVKTDIMASNGVIHVIDKVIMPNTETASL